MNNIDKELAVELTIAQIQAASVIKLNINQTGRAYKAEDVSKLVEYYYKTLKSLDDK